MAKYKQHFEEGKAVVPHGLWFLQRQAPRGELRLLTGKSWVKSGCLPGGGPSPLTVHPQTLGAGGPSAVGGGEGSEEAAGERALL